MSDNEIPSGAPPPTVVAPTVQSVVSVRSPSGWQLDRSVGIPLVLLLVGQLATGIWYAAGANSQISDHERRISHLEVTLDERTKARDEQMRILTDTLSELRERLAAIESGVKYLTGEHQGRR